MVRSSVAPAILGFVQNRAPDLPSGLKLVFLLGAETMLAALLQIFIYCLNTYGLRNILALPQDQRHAGP